MSSFSVFSLTNWGEVAWSNGLKSVVLVARPDVIGGDASGRVEKGCMYEKICAMGWHGKD
jgi:hypothetical protein